MEIKNTKDLKRSPKVKALLYGAPGSGKTTLAGTFPKPIYFNIERGLDAIIEQEVDYVDITTWEELEEAFKFIDDYETVIIDSVSELQELRIAEVKETRGKEMSFTDWSALADEFRRLIKALEKQDKHIVFIAHEKEQDDDGTILKRFDLAGQLKDKVARHFNMIGYMFVETDENNEPLHKVRFKTTLKEHAKTRYSDVPAVVDNPSFDTIYPHVLTSTGGNGTPKKVKEVIEKKGQR